MSKVPMIILSFAGWLSNAAHLGSFPQQTMNYTATAPAQATVGVAGQFQGTVTSTDDSAPGSLWGTDSIVGNLRYVPAGTFTQGTPSTEVGGWAEEGP